MAIVRNVKIDKDKIRELIKVEVRRGDDSKFSRDAFKAVGKMADKMVGVGAGKDQSAVASAVKFAAVKGMSDGLQTIGTVLKAGIPTEDGIQYGWKPLSRDWVRRKRPKMKDKFWKNTGNLSFGFNNFVNNYSRTLAGSATSVKVRSRKNTYGHKVFSYEITVSLPAHSEPFLTMITRDSFLSGYALSGRGVPSSSPTFNKISMLEGTGKTHRPFIAKMMAAKGVEYTKNVNAIIARAVRSSGDFKI